MLIGKIKSDESIKTTNPLAYYDRSEVFGKCPTVKIFGKIENLPKNLEKTKAEFNKRRAITTLETWILT